MRLLVQPGGYEGFSLPDVEAEPGDPRVEDLEDEPERGFDRDATGRAAHDLLDTHDDEVASVDELLRDDRPLADPLGPLRGGLEEALLPVKRRVIGIRSIDD